MVSTATGPLSVQSNSSTALGRTFQKRRPREGSPAVERFKARIAWGRITHPEACWLWTGGTTNDGYGCFSVQNHTVLAHRFSYEYHNGPIPSDMCVLHRCDTPGCVNPMHLLLGTPADNSDDCDRKGRRPRGSQLPNAKLTESQVIELRARYAAGGISMYKLADEYGLTQSTVHRIIKRYVWCHI